MRFLRLCLAILVFRRFLSEPILMCYCVLNFAFTSRIAFEVNTYYNACLPSRKQLCSDLVIDGCRATPSGLIYVVPYTQGSLRNPGLEDAATLWLNALYLYSSNQKYILPDSIPPDSSEICPAPVVAAGPGANKRPSLLSHSA
jgi:hypothetical protein